MDYSIKIGGEAGQGIQTIGDSLAKVFARSGYHVFTNQDYESRIRGGHNFYQIRFSDKPVMAPRDRVDLVVALDKESFVLHEDELTEYGQIIYDSASVRQEKKGAKYFDIPFERLAVEEGGSKIMSNTVATGAVLGMLGLGVDFLIGIIRHIFLKKGEEITQANINAAMRGHDFAVRECLKCSFAAVPSSQGKMLMSGAEAIGLGALSAGCKFYSAYPMTPSTGIMDYLAAKEEEYGLIVEQAEDEIAAINMAIGASFAGVRAMTGTSGGGFALMVEGLSLAGMTETPIVIALGQRPGPATGLPTRTEQGDLLYALHTAHGEFPRVIFAPGTPEQAVYLTNKAFDVAEKYQIPAFVVFDTYLADSQVTCGGIDRKRISFTDYRMRGGELENLPGYKRHVVTGTGVSPLAVPGASRHLVVTDSDEHNEEGHIREDAETRRVMVEKRLMKKMPLIRQEIAPPFLCGAVDPDVVLTGWGSTYGVLKEAVDELSKNVKVGMLHFAEVYPFPPTEPFDYLSLLRNAGLTLCIENNATGQFARLMRAETGYVFTARINRYDGRPFTREGLLTEIMAFLNRDLPQR